MSKPSVKPAEPKPQGASPAAPNANGVVQGVWTPGQGGSNSGAK